ncbi:hypothetical protein KR093_005482, partial [Drosophila rubida]
EELEALNNCEVFNQMRIEFTNFHKDVKRLDTFNYFSGNERHIKELQRRLIGVLLEHNLVEKQVRVKKEESDEEDEEDEEEDEDEEELVVKPTASCNLDQLRGIMMYLVLNSAIVENVKPDSKLAECNPQCVHLLNQLLVPLPQLVTVSLAFGCGLQDQFYELLSCAPHWLGAQFIDSLNETLSHLVSDSQEVLPLLASTLNAVTNALGYKSRGRRFEVRPELLLQAAMRLLQRHLLDNEDRLGLIRSSVGRHRYLGEAMKQLLNVLLQALAALRVPLDLPAYFLIYSLRSPPLDKQEADNLQSQHLLDPKLRVFAGKLMDAVQRLLPQISVDVYMTWYELPSGQPLFSLQTYISNQCEQLLKCLDQHHEALSKHSLGAQLENFAKGALTFEERLDQLSLGELLSFLDEEPHVEQSQLQAALNQLLKRPIAFGNDECVEVMIKYVQLLNMQHANLIMDHLQQALLAKRLELEMEDDEPDYVDYDELYGELLAKVLYPIFKALSNPEQKLQLLEKRDKLQLLDKLSFQLNDELSSTNRVAFFNALTSDELDFPLLQFLDMCYEQPADSWLALAQLGMTHIDFGKLYCSTAIFCAGHALYYLDYTVHQLMQDESLVKHNYSTEFLELLYELPFMLHGRCRYPTLDHVEHVDNGTLLRAVEQLKLAQSNYLSACALGMEKYTDAKNYPMLDRLSQLLLKLQHVEQRLQVRSRRRRRLRHPQTQKRRRLAKKYEDLISKFGIWRISHWKLGYELISTLDKLRANLDSFELPRTAVLDQFMEYYTQNMPRALRLSPGLCKGNRQLITNCSVCFFQISKELSFITLQLLQMASSLEATYLLGATIRHRTDLAVLTEVARSVDNAGCQAAQEGYNFLLKAFMVSFKDVLIKTTPRSDYPLLVKHLLRTPKLMLPENCNLAVDNLKAL